MIRLLLITLLLLSSEPAYAEWVLVDKTDDGKQSCYKSSITSPTPFMGNNDEIFELLDGSIWKVQYEYSYLYEYYPSVTICPSAGKLIINGTALAVVNLSQRQTVPAPKQGRRSEVGDITVVTHLTRCRDYFLADGPQGYYLLEWYGGHSPSVGDTIIGELGSYGFKDVYYPKADVQGRVYVDDYLLSRSRAKEKYAEKCN